MGEELCLPGSLGYVFTAMRIVNAIPHVCAGKPGILTIHNVIKLRNLLYSIV